MHNDFGFILRMKQSPRGHNAESFTDYKRAKAEFRKAHRGRGRDACY